MRLRLEASIQHEIDRRELFQQRIERPFAVAAQLVHQRETIADETSTSVAPASRCVCESLPG
jgi:hypothetical protein